METLASARPVAYRGLVFALALLGYAYLLLVVVVLSLLLLASLKTAVLQFALLFAALLAVILRAMWVKVASPAGEPLSARAEPELFALLESLQRQLHTPRLHRVLLVPDFNAAISQVPRLGALGWYRNHLLIGLPLMKALTVEQFRAVMGHELGHLSRGHARAANWIYRLRLIWVRLEAAFAQRPRWGGRLIRGFYRWYIPYFNAASVPLARANEYEADATSKQLTSSRSVAQALTGVSIGGSYFNQKYWPSIQALVKESAEPASTALSGFMTTGLQQVTSEEVSGWQNAALAARTSYADTHPALADRLRAIGAEAEFAPPPRVEDSAAQLLGTERPRLEARLDDTWRQRTAGAWKQAHQEAQKGRLRLAELRAQATAGELNALQSVELAGLEENVGAGPQVALSMRREILTQFPDSAAARFALARQLLQHDDSEGIALMERAIEQEPDAQLGGAELLRNYYYRRGDSARAQQWQQRYLTRARVLFAAQQERARFLLSDSVGPHLLSPETVARLVEQLQVMTQLKRAYLVRKITAPPAGKKPCYVFGIESGSRWTLSTRARTSAALQWIRERVTFPGPTLIVNLQSSSPRFSNKLRRVQGARIVG